MRIYKPKDIDAMSIYEVRSAYQQMRRAANKRITNIEKRGVGVTKPSKKGGITGGIRYTSGGGGYRFPAASTMTNEELRVGLADISAWIRDPSHTVRGEQRQREFTIGQFRAKGYDFINDENFYDVMAFMEHQRELYSDKVFDSSAALDIYEVSERIGIDPNVLAEDYDYFKKHIDAIEDLRPVRSEWGASKAGIRDKIRKLEKRK